MYYYLIKHYTKCDIGGAKVRALLANKRKELNMTQEEVAERVGIARTTYAMIETGKRNTSVENVKKIAKVLNFEWTLFFEEKCHETRTKQTTA